MESRVKFNTDLNYVRHGIYLEQFAVMHLY